tara:strand:+ start:1115 stop:1609 length:495 start_codon:yes stop_codon:yes gene_type:complete
MIDATFWVGVSFFIFLGLLVYFGIPNRIKVSLDQLIQKIKSQVDEAESLKEEANNLLSESEKKLSNAKREIKEMMVKANEDTEKLILKTNSDFHKVMENRKRGAEERIAQMKDQALRDIKRTSVQIAMISIENLLKNSIDKNKLEKIYQDSIEETKLALKQKSS